MTIMFRWRIKLCGIHWDDGNGEYDVSTLPKTVQTIVNASEEEEAIDTAMEEIGDGHGFLIEGVDTAEVELLGPDIWE
jgi:hypothetical protein